MGGRPWQSKGCRACRRRKIRCDGQQPACGRCIKRGIECPGYQKTHIFNVHQETFRQGKKMSPHELIRHNNQDLDSLILRRPPRVVTPIIAIDAASINRDQILSLFLDNYFPAFHSGSPHGVELWHSLFEGFFMLPKKTHMLDTAITAISCVYLGKIKNDGRVFGYGLQLYNRAIQDMSSMICQNIHTDDIIYTSVIFQEIENCHCPQGFQTWLAHVAGTNAIMKHYQYIKSRNPIVDAIYDQWQKFRIICLTMGRGLSEEEYRYCREPSEGRPLVEIINIFVEFTPLGADIESVDQSNQEACEKLLSACLAQKQSVLEWNARRKKTFGGGPLVLTDELLRCIDIEPVDVTFGKPYSFASLDDALLHVLYCMAMAMVSPMVARARTLVHSLRQGDQRVNDHTIDEEYSTMQIYADQIIRSVPFFVQEKHKLLGPHMVMFGVVTACKAYIKLGMFEKFDWCQKTLGSFGDRGFESCHNYRQDAWCHWNSGNSHTADPFRSMSVRGDELMSASPSLYSEDQPSDTSDCGQCPSSSCVEWEYIRKEAGSSMLEPSLLDDPWQEWAVCCVST